MHPPPAVPHLLVDGMNVIGSRPNGWWRDRDAAARLLVGRLQRLRAADGDVVTVVFDGRPSGALPEGDHAGVTVLYALRRGPDAADDRIVEVLAAAALPRTWTVVTSDRSLRERSEALGASVVGAGALLARLDETQP